MSVLTFFSFTALLCISLAEPVPSHSKHDREHDRDKEAPDVYSSEMRDKMAKMLGEIGDMMNSQLPDMTQGMNMEDQGYFKDQCMEAVTSCSNYMLNMYYAAMDPKRDIPDSGEMVLTFMSSPSDKKPYIPFNSIESFLSGDKNQKPGTYAC